MSVLFYFVTCLVLSYTEAARILAVFPTPSISHQVIFRPLVNELIKRGHEVVTITTDPAFPKGAAPANLTEIDVHDISYKIWKETIMTVSRGVKDEMIYQFTSFEQCMVDIVDAQLQNEEVQKMIRDKDQKFDVLLLEACVKSALVFSHIYKVPVIHVSSFGAVTDNYEVVGAPNHPFIFPSAMHTRIHNLSIWEKISQMYHHYQVEKVIWNNQVLENTLLRKHFGKNAPTITELNNNVQMLILNIHPLFEGVRPVPPNVVYMGGMHHKPEKPLPTDLKSYLDSSKNGIIYISFGTNVDPSLLPFEKIQILINVFSKLPYDVLWKWNEDVLPGRSDNIKISKWLPQPDLLKHPKIKLFVTQGGLQSTDEAIFAGVPLVGIPMLGDQWYNVEKYVHLKIGVNVDLETLSEDTFKDALQTIINDDSYRKNIVRLRTLMLDEPMKPFERALWWIEYVLRHGGATHLRPPTANISWSQYLELELVLTLLAMAMIVITAFVVSCIIAYKYILRRYLLKLKIKRA